MLCPVCLARVNPEACQPADATSRECPSCHGLIPLVYIDRHQTHRPVILSLTGLVGHGKTAFLLGLLQQLRNVPPGFDERRFSLFLPRDSDRAEIMPMLTDLDEGRLPPGSILDERRPPIIAQLNGFGRGEGIALLIHDTGGEAFTDTNRWQRFARYAINSNSLTLCLSLTELEHEARDRAELDSYLSSYSNVMLANGIQPSQKSLIVALTKGDELLADRTLPESARHFLAGHGAAPDQGLWHRLEGLSTDLAEWLLSKQRYAHFVRTAASTFLTVKYCIISALGSKPRLQPDQSSFLDIRCTPRAVMLPLYWCMRMIQPRVQVTAPGEPPRLFFDLAEAIAQSPAGATVRVSDGEHTLDRAAEVERPLTIRGSGCDRTRIKVSCDNAALECRPSGPLRVEGLDLSLNGGGGDVVRLSDGQTELVGCRFSGRLDGLGIGVVIDGQAEAMLRDCEIKQCGDCGVLASAQVAPVVSKCHVHHNGNDGIRLREQASGRYEDCTIEENGGSGIVVTGGAQPVIARNQVVRNRADGIRFESGTGGMAHDNQANENLQAGIGLGEGSVAGVQNNTCERNRQFGIRVRRGGRLLRRKNQLSGNQPSDVGWSE